MTSPDPVHEQNLRAVLRAVARAAYGADGNGQDHGAPVDHVAFELGRVRPDLLNSRRERLMTELRQRGLVSYHVFNAIGGRWKPTPAGHALLASMDPDEGVRA